MIFGVIYLFFLVVFVIIPVLAVALFVRWLFTPPKGNEPSNFEIAMKFIEAQAAKESLKASFDKEVKKAAAPPPPPPKLLPPHTRPNHTNSDSGHYYPSSNNVPVTPPPDDDDDDNDNDDADDQADRYRRNANIDKCYDCLDSCNDMRYGDIGNGICSECEGNGHAAFLSDEPCSKCGFSGKCPSCSGKGFNYKY